MPAKGLDLSFWEGNRDSSLEIIVHCLFHHHHVFSYGGRHANEPILAVTGASQERVGSPLGPMDLEENFHESDHPLIISRVHTQHRRWPRSRSTLGLVGLCSEPEDSLLAHDPAPFNSVQCCCRQVRVSYWGLSAKPQLPHDQSEFQWPRVIKNRFLQIVQECDTEGRCLFLLWGFSWVVHCEPPDSRILCSWGFETENHGEVLHCVDEAQWCHEPYLIDNQREDVGLHRTRSKHLVDFPPWTWIGAPADMAWEALHTSIQYQGIAVAWTSQTGFHRSGLLHQPRLWGAPFPLKAQPGLRKSPPPHFGRYPIFLHPGPNASLVSSLGWEGLLAALDPWMPVVGLSLLSFWKIPLLLEPQNFPGACGNHPFPLLSPFGSPSMNSSGVVGE